MAKITLLIVGILIVIMGIWGLLSNYYPQIANIYDPIWHGISKIIVGGICIFISLKDKKA